MKYILCQPAIQRFEWELEVCLTRLKKLGIQDITLLFAQGDPAIPNKLKDKYQVEVHVYKDERADKHYIPSIKPYLWMRYLEENPTREKETYFYLDCDVLLRAIPEVIPTENTWYASDCTGYIGIDYIDSKGSDLLNRMCEVVGIDESLIRTQKPSGGAQWVIKNPSYDYWAKVYVDSINLYNFLSKVESYYVKNNGPSYIPIQKWTAEMWAQLWNVYHFGLDVKTDKELDFCWPTNSLEDYNKVKIYHNAGVLNENQGMFFKGKYVNRSPFKDNFSGIDRNRASIEYVRAIQDVKEGNLMKYRVLHYFTDLQDKDKEYHEGDTFPRPANKKVANERVKELLSNKNNQGRPVIEIIEE
jgi:hypothetical protein